MQREQHVDEKFRLELMPSCETGIRTSRSGASFRTTQDTIRGALKDPARPVPSRPSFTHALLTFPQACLCVAVVHTNWSVLYTFGHQPSTPAATYTGLRAHCGVDEAELIFDNKLESGRGVMSSSLTGR
jgi:hypothetical protein